MNRRLSIFISLILLLSGCSEPAPYQVWECTQTAQITSDTIATQISKIEYLNPQYATSYGRVSFENAKLNKNSVLTSKLTFNKSQSGKKIELTLLTAEINILEDELDVFSEGRARALLPEIGETISGEIIYEEEGFTRVQYEIGEVQECNLVKNSART